MQAIFRYSGNKKTHNTNNEIGSFKKAAYFFVPKIL